MITTLSKWGNSQGLRIPKSILESSEISENDHVEIKSKPNIILIKKKEKKLGRINIKNLFKDFNGEYEKIDEIDFGKKEGKEIW